MSYPNSIDSFTPAVTGQVIAASSTNAVTTAVVAIENTLGVLPAGPGYTTVGAAVAAAAASTSLYFAQNFT